MIKILRNWIKGILAEMINCTEKQIEKRKMKYSKRIMFKGTSCYPISPYKNKEQFAKQTVDSIFLILHPGGGSPPKRKIDNIELSVGFVDCWPFWVNS